MLRPILPFCFQTKQLGNALSATCLVALQAADTVKQQASQLAGSKARLQEAAAAQTMATEVSQPLASCLCVSTMFAYLLCVLRWWSQFSSIDLMPHAPHDSVSGKF